MRERDGTGVAGLFRLRGFVLLWAGQTVSELGSAVGFVAFPLVAVIVLHASDFEVGVVAAAGPAAWLLIGLPAGAWVDRLPRRALLVGCDLGRAVVMAAVPVAWAMHLLTVGLLVAVALGVGLLSVLFDVAYPAYLPSVVGTGRLIEANSVLAASDSGSNVVGPGLGGALVGVVGAPVTLVADAVSFLLSAGSLAAIRDAEARPATRPSGQRLGQEIRAGLRYAWSHPLIRSVAVTGTLANLVVGGYNAVIVLFLARQLALAPGLIGVLFSLAGVGGVLGALVAAPLARWLGDARVMWGSLIVSAAGGLLLPLTAAGGRLAWYVVGTLPLIMGISAFIVCVRAAVQVAAPEAMRGRVTATIRLFGRGATPLGALAAGALAGAFTPRTALTILMAFLVLAPVWLLLTPIARVRDVAQLAPAPPTP
jgi:MFS family permease